MDQNVSAVLLLVGLAVGVDYSLFYLKREREERAAGKGHRAALEAAAATSGRSVLISGVTVMIAMAGMLFSGDKTYLSFGIATMMVVGVAMIGSLTVLPGAAVEARRQGREGPDPVPRPAPPRAAARTASGRRSSPRCCGTRSSRRSPPRPCCSSMALPVLQHPHRPVRPRRAAEERRRRSETIDKIQDTFPGGADPAIVAIKADTDSPATKHAIADAPQRRRSRAARCTARSRSTSTRRTPSRGSRSRSPGKGTDDASNAALADAPQRRSCRRRSAQVPGATYAVTGGTAASADANALLKRSAPLVFGFVLTFAFLLLLVSFRSIVIAVKAIVLNLLSVAAAYGVLVAIFQYGWGENLLELPVERRASRFWLPIFMFVILFGLSMDYHVFILSRVREAYDRGMKTEDAVAHGIKTTAGVVTSAAIVMVGVFSIFATLPIIDMKEMGIGLAAAVLIDATIVRGGAAARDDEAARRLELVPAELARVAAEARARSRASPRAGGERGVAASARSRARGPVRGDRASRRSCL